MTNSDMLTMGNTRHAISFWSAAAATIFLFVGSVSAQKPPVVDPIPSHDVKVSVDSGDYFNQGNKPQVVWKQIVSVPDAQWLRLNFKFLILANDPRGGTTSTLKIVALKDGATQWLNGTSAREWRNTSAYFNGDSVLLELTAWPNGRLNRVAMETVTAGDIPEADIDESICDDVDDRVLSKDIRVGRTVPGGCTAWLFNDRKNCMLTAGHCASSTQVIEFNVPLSNPNGSYNHPGPEHQYPIDPTSMQFVNGGVGDDWCYFGCFANSNTGLTAFEAQGDSFQLELPQPVGGGDQIRITGHGSTSAPVDPTWNGAQKTHVGPHLIFTGSDLGYRTDTTGGNSGSPVIFEIDGTAIGIHTHGGCGSGGSGNNWGTGANNAGFQNALANPLGICQGSLDFQYPNGRPTLVDPAGGTTMRVVVADGGVQPQPGTGVLHFDTGSGFQSIPMVEISNNVYDAVFPASTCGSVVNYYVSAQSVSAEQFTDPSDAPSLFYSAISGNDVELAFADDFESDMGWTVSGDATDGQWERGIPAGGGDRGDPPTDADGSGNCYITDNADGNSDVDGGSTVLTSPIIDATSSAGQEALLSYDRWYSNHFGSAPESDIFVVEISNNGGTTWTNVETVGPSGAEVRGGWFHRSFRISDFLQPTNQMRLRFTASDLGDGSVVEAGVDGVQVQLVTCQQSVLPTSFSVITGSVESGGLPELLDSDDLHLNLDPAFLQNRYQLVFTVNTTSPNEAPTALSFRFESNATNFVGDIQQTIEWFNYTTSQYEQVDSRVATSSDSVVVAAPTGDPIRFVQTGTGSMQARIRYENGLPWWVFSTVNLFLPFETHVDQTVWTITP